MTYTERIAKAEGIKAVLVNDKKRNCGERRGIMIAQELFAKIDPMSKLRYRSSVDGHVIDAPEPNGEYYTEVVASPNVLSEWDEFVLDADASAEEVAPREWRVVDGDGAIYCVSMEKSGQVVAERGL